jgi:hypothetical protein
VAASRATEASSSANMTGNGQRDRADSALLGHTRNETQID